MTGEILTLDDRVSFRVAEAALSVIRERTGKYADDEATWDSFIIWRGESEADYLRRIHAGRQYIFYSLLQDLYSFGEEVCGESITTQSGKYLTEELLVRHMPDLLEAIMAQTAALFEQITWLVEQFLSGTTGEIYELKVVPQSDERLLIMSMSYRFENEMIDYLTKTGHNPERAFENSFGVIGGALVSLLERAICGFSPEQLKSELRGLQGNFSLRISDENRFHLEQFIEILLEYVGRLRQQAKSAIEPADAEACLCTSESMKTTWDNIRKTSSSDEIVLLCGESGTGKSYYAQVIHKLSTRRDGPFVEVGLTSDVGSDNLIQSNLFGHVRGAFTGATEEKPGLFALADGGTIFLDEVGDASSELQAKLLRVLEKKSFKMLGGPADKKVDVRIIAATNRNLAQMVHDGTFREDLYYRLNVIRIELPALRYRTEDMPLLVKRLFEKVCREARKEDVHLSDETLELICNCNWPGNIRQVENALRHAVAFAEKAEISAEDLPLDAAAPVAVTRQAQQTPGESSTVVSSAVLMKILATEPRPPDSESFEWQGHVDYAKREYMKALIKHCSGNLNEIAMHWDRSSERTLLKLIREFHLEDELHAARKKHK